MVIEADALKQYIGEARELFKEGISKLEEFEEAVLILAKTLESYQDLIDISTVVPKEKFIKYRLSRLIKRMSFERNKTVLGIRIKFHLGNYQELRDIIINYIDSHIRPTDTLFLFDDYSIGIIYILDKNLESKVKVLTRIEEILSNFEIQLDYKVKSNIRWDLSTTELDPSDSVEEFLTRLKEGRE
ncbi:hypothetical protein [Desulfurobacterium sp.]|uniref:hypothetical protein n=1 Tax=Desulfurobacterium sp. TaxID=2004706 RepID=UPI000429F8B4|nr:hypothetical protein [Desulfurobacterium sp.]